MSIRTRVTTEKGMAIAISLLKRQGKKFSIDQISNTIIVYL